MIDPTFSIGEVAAMLGISAHTLRAWERRHLVVRPGRTASGRRRYTDDDVELLRQVKHQRHVHGLSLRVATMAAQGLIVLEGGEAPGPADGAADAPIGGDGPLSIVGDLVPEIVIVLDEAGCIMYANMPFLNLYDLAPGDLRGMSFADLVDPFDRAKAVQTYRGHTRQRRCWELNLATKRRRALFSFDCWPVRASREARTVLVGRDLGSDRDQRQGRGVFV